MEITTTSKSGLEQKIHVLDEPITEDKIRVSVEDVGDLQELLSEDRKKYADAIYIDNWHEVVFAIDGRHDQVDYSDIRLKPITSYHSQAIRKGAANDVTPVLIEGLVLTRDNKIVYGLRGGQERNGIACIAPAGSITFGERGADPLFHSFYEETREELGIDRRYMDMPTLIGSQTDPDWTRGINLIFRVYTTKESEDLVESHEITNAYYNACISENGYTHEQALSVMKSMGLENIDAWEHEKLLFIENEPGAISEVIESRKLAGYPLLDIGRGPLMALDGVKVGRGMNRTNYDL